MAGAGTNYFTQQVNKYNVVVEQAQAAVNKVNAAKQALAILAKPTITQAEAESLIALHDEAQ